MGACDAGARDACRDRRGAVLERSRHRRPEPPLKYWRPGSEIVWHFGPPGGPDWEEPMRVVRDDARGLVAWLPIGTPVRHLARTDGRPLRAELSTLFTAPRIQVRTVWQRTSVLRIVTPGSWWSVWVFFDGSSGAFQGWYVNIEQPHVRDTHSTHTWDHVLDVWVKPDRSHGRKDEHELVLAVQQGRYSAAEAKHIRQIAVQIEAAIDAWSSPFCDGWEHFKPDPGWPAPTLPPLRVNQRRSGGSS